MNSSSIKTSKTLAARLEKFLLEIANLNNSEESAARLSDRFADFELSDVAFRAFPRVVGNEKADERAALIQLQKFFQGIWVERDTRRREWNGALMRVYLATPPMEQTFGRLQEDPRAVVFPEPLPESPLERALDYLLKWHYRARYCENPGCPAPYFFGNRSTQRYCGESCAEHGQREAKRRWWEQRGDQWRRQRNASVNAKKKAQKTNK